MEFVPETWSLALGELVPIPTSEPVTTRAFVLYAPAFTVLSEKTSKIGRPDIVLTEKSEPERLSATLKREPEVPTTSNLLDG